MGNDDLIGDTDWFTLEPICMFCKQDFVLKGTGYVGYSGFIEAKCGCRSLSVNQEVLRVLDELSTSAEKSLILNGFVRMKRATVGAGVHVRTVVDVVSTVAEARRAAENMPVNRNELADAMQNLRFVKVL